MNLSAAEITQVRNALLQANVSGENADAFIAFFTADEFSQELMDKIQFVDEYGELDRGNYYSMFQGIGKYVFDNFGVYKEKDVRFLQGLYRLVNYNFAWIIRNNLRHDWEYKPLDLLTGDEGLMYKFAQDEGVFVSEYYENTTRRDEILASLRRLIEIVEKRVIEARGILLAQYFLIRYPAEELYKNTVEVDGHPSIAESMIGSVEIAPEDKEIFKEYEDILLFLIKKRVNELFVNEEDKNYILDHIELPEKMGLNDRHYIVLERESMIVSKYALRSAVSNFVLSRKITNVASTYIITESGTHMFNVVFGNINPFTYDLCKYNLIDLFDMDKGRFLQELMTTRDEEFKKYILENRKDIVFDGFAYMDYKAQYGLYKIFKEEHPEYLEEIFKDKESYKKKMIDYITKVIFSKKVKDESDMEQIIAYLEGRGDVENVVDLVFKYRQFGSVGWALLAYGTTVYKKCTQDDEFTARVEVLVIIFENSSTYYTIRYNAQKVAPMLYKRVKDAVIPLMILGLYLDRIAEIDAKNVETLVPVFAEDLEEMGEYLYDEFKNTSLKVKNVLLQAMSTDADKWKEQILSYAQECGKETQDTLIKIFSENKELRRHAFDYIVGKKKPLRELAIKVFAASMDQEAFDVLTQVSETEKDAKLQKLLMQTLAEANIEIPESEMTVEKIVEKLHKADKAKEVSWVFDTTFSPVHDLDGNEVSREVLEGILIPFAFMKTVEISKDSAFLSKNCNKEELEKFMTGAFILWLENGADAKKKWILYPASIFGGSKVKPALIECIDKSVELSRGALAGEVVKALSLNSDPTAIVVVDNMSRKYKHKGVRNAAAEAMESAASIIGITRAQLEDRIVPTLDFDEDFKRVFDYGNRQFVVTLEADLSLSCATAEGKAIKALPSPSASDDTTKAGEASKAFKELKKELKLVVDTQTTRLEEALAVSRYWTKEEWCTLFIKNPIMHQFAIGLVWGTYVDGVLVDSFRYMEDGSFNTMEENEYAIKDDALIGLVHPLDMNDADILSWKQQLEDYEVKQPFDQLGRESFTVAEDEQGRTLCTRFNGIVMSDSTLVNRLTKKGWSRGEVLDNGDFFAMYRKDEKLGLATTLFFSGINVGYMGEGVTIQQLAFYKSDNISTDPYGINNGEDKKAIKLDKVQARYFSEMLLQVKNATTTK